MERYDPATIEPKWQAVWEREGAFETPNPNGNGHGERERAHSSYVLEMLPYPSGELHMGHVKNYTMGDVLCHFRRRNGMLVLHPMGYDAFGLPAENAAIREGGHPREVTEREHRRDPPPDAADGLVDRLGARAVDRRPALLPLDAVDLPAPVRARPGLQEASRRSTGARSTRPCWPTSR